MNTCTTDIGGVGNCNNCPPDRSTPAGIPPVGSNGLAELPGNDFMVTLGVDFYDTAPAAAPRRSLFNEGGIFMHELGHTLGLHHAGDLATPIKKPNYLSVMNERYVQIGILSAREPGSIISDPGLRRLDFSRTTLPFLDESDLDERAGVSTLSSGFTDIMLFNGLNGRTRGGATAGPVDWNGNGVIDEERVSVDLNNDEGGAGPGTSILPGFTDWPNGVCSTSADCPVNQILTAIAGTTIRQPYVQNRCQPLVYPFQCFQWGKTD